VLRDDGLTVQVYHVADLLSKGMRVYRDQSSALEPENGDLAMTGCGKQETRTATGLGRNRCSQWRKKYRLGKLAMSWSAH